MKNAILLSGALVLLFVLGTAPLLRAQQPAAETLEQNVALPSAHQNLPPGQIFDQDLGEISPVQSYPKPPTFAASVEQQVFYSNNVFYSDADPRGSAAYLGNYSVAYVPYSTRDWTPQIGLQYNMVRYDRVAAADFDNENLSLSSNYVFTKDRAWSWTTAVDLSRFTSPHHDGDMFYNEVVYDNEIGYTREIIPNSLFFDGAYEITYHEAHPSEYDRVDNALSLSLVYYPIQVFSLSFYVRPASWTFPTDSASQHDREDFNLSEGLDASWKPTKYLTFDADIVETDDFSSAPGQSFSVWTPGLSIGATITF